MLVFGEVWLALFAQAFEGIPGGLDDFDHVFVPQFLREPDYTPSIYRRSMLEGLVFTMPHPHAFETAQVCIVATSYTYYIIWYVYIITESITIIYVLMLTCIYNILFMILLYISLHTSMQLSLIPSASLFLEGPFWPIPAVAGNCTYSIEVMGELSLDEIIGNLILRHDVTSVWCHQLIMYYIYIFMMLSQFVILLDLITHTRKVQGVV